MTTQPYTASHPLNCQVAAKEQVVEMIMTLWGRHQPMPLQVRRLLNSDSFERNQAFLQKVISGEIEP